MEAKERVVETSTNANGRQQDKTVQNGNGVHKVHENVETKTEIEIDMPSESHPKGCCGRKKAQQAPVEERVGFFELFRFADNADIVLMLVGTLCMMAVGVAIPVNLVFFGDLMTKFVVSSKAKSLPSANYSIEINDHCFETLRSQTAKDVEVTSMEDLLYIIEHRYVIAFCCIGCITFLCGYFGMTLWVWTAERQILKIRTAFFKAIMRQSIGWFDVTEAGELNTRMVEDMDRLHDGYGDKMATFIQWVTTFIGGYALGFGTGWKLTLVVLSVAPLLVITAASLGKFMMTLVKKELQAYAKAGSVVEEILSSIRTVAAFGGERQAEKRYADNLYEAKKEGVKKATVGGATQGIFWGIVFGIFALAFWYGAKLTRDDCLQPGTILQVFFGVFIGSMSLGHAAPILENFSNARGAAALIYKTIDMKSEIDNSSEAGTKPDKFNGDIEFKKVEFTYPARKDVQVLKGLDISIKKGQTVALVGESGCGKSTTIQLLQRFYNPQDGRILIDGLEIDCYNINWLRDQMGIVSQEPTLFATSIAENIRLGGRWSDPHITQEQIEKAAKLANCFDFINQLPNGFETLVGERGVQLSGGQKQRIAIARALVRNPSILLLDEATSALDTQSEAIVQDALDKAREGRTTIVIAHRLSTVRNADKIYAFRSGVVHEQGSHQELMEKKGVYYSLCMQQSSQPAAHQSDLAYQSTNPESEYKLAQPPKEQYFDRPASTAHINVEPPPDYDSLYRSPAHSDASNPKALSRNNSARQSTRLQRDDPLRSSVRSIRSFVSDGGVFGMANNVVDQEEESLTEQNVKERKEAERAGISAIAILKMNGPEWYLIVFGVLASIASGVTQPAFVLLMSEIMGVLAEPNPKTQEEKVAQFSYLIVIVGLAAALFVMLQQFMFALSGERLTERLRQQSFAAMLRQEIAYFDDESNGVGVLCARLAQDASLVKGATGIRIGIFVQSMANIVAALVIAFYYVWKLTLAMVAFMPLSIGAGLVQARILRGYAQVDKDGIEHGGKIAQEAISNVRTVTSLNQQKYFTGKFDAHFNTQYLNDKKKSFVYGVAFAVSQSLMFFMYALCFGYGGYLITTEDVPFFHIFRVFACITFGGMAIGRAMSQVPDYAKAKMAAYKIKMLLERKSAIDPGNMSGNIPEQSKGDVEFKELFFNYPSRKSVKVLQGLSVTIKQAETVALVGSSGCGKSTTVALLERFYSPKGGLVMFDGCDVKDLNLKWLRQHLGIVSQEPVLFDASIAENISYGDNSRTVSMDEIMEAAKKANAHNFITSLPAGYETNVGARGTQLSGGQKQRVAIARALIRNPSVLLLDEATSALDTESEKIVQEALDKARLGRTAIVIAHRLSTIKNADKIAVINGGVVVELGTYQELIDKKGFFYNLVNAQL